LTIRAGKIAPPDFAPFPRIPAKPIPFKKQAPFS